jgi:acyl carrier protein
VNSIGEFVALVRVELGMPVTVEDVGRELTELPGWDSMHLLWLVTLLEQKTGRNISVIELLEAPNLEYIYGLTVPPAKGYGEDTRDD